MENEYNFDCPDAFDYDLMIQTLQRLRKGKSVDVPVYNFTTHARDKHKVGGTASQSISSKYKYLINI